MTNRRRYRERKRKVDPAQEILDNALRVGEYVPFYCGKHGKFLLLPGVRGICPVCEQPCFTPEEWQHKRQQSLRDERQRRIQLLRNHLE